MKLEFLTKMKGLSKAPPKAVGAEIWLALAGSAAAMAALSLIHGFFVGASGGLPLMVAPFGASAVLVFGAMRSPLAQPRNVIGGHVLSGLLGVTVYHLAGGHEALAVSLAVPLAIAAMHLTGTLHPPGGATAFLTAAGGPSIHQWGYWYVLSPCLMGSLALVAVALIINNIPKDQRYPQFW